MKKLFIYYSLTGNGDEIAKFLKNNGYDIRKVDTKKELPNNFIFRILTGGFKALINYKDKLLDFDNSIDDYEEIIIGSPIWNSRVSSPINTVLDTINLKNKKIKFIFYSGSGKSNKATELIKNRYPKSIIYNLKEPKINKKELSKIDLK